MAIIIEMPKLSDTMVTGTLINWLKNTGDKVAPGDMLAEVETDKATMEVENFDEGILLKQYVKAGAEVAIGAPICAIGEEGETAPEAEGVSGEEPEKKAEAPEASKPPEKEKSKPSRTDKKEAPEESASKEKKPKDDATETFVEKAPKPSEDVPRTDRVEKGQEDDGRIKASPLARKIARDNGLDLAMVKGSGPGGRIVRSDVEAAVRTAATKPRTAPAAAEPPREVSAPAPIPAEGQDIPVSNLRKIIARRLVESKRDVPHFYLQIEVDSGPLGDLRVTLNESLASLPVDRGGIKLTVNDLILKASALALLRVPSVNRSWGDEKIRQHGSVHLAFGVAIEDGLVTPVIRDAHQKSLREIGVEARELISKARARRLKPDEMSNSTFTVTNLGMFGIETFYGIINPPNAAILSVGASIQKPVVTPNGQIAIGHRMKVGLAGDHRVIDGASGAEFLAVLKGILEKPALMLV